MIKLNVAGPVQSPYEERMAAALSPLSEPQTAVLMGIGVESRVLALFEDCFRPMRINIRTVRMHTEQDLEATRFNGCVIHLDEWAPELLARIRQSNLNAAALVYGVGPLTQVAAVARFGLTAVLEKCTEAEVAEIVEASHLLLVNRLRRFVRLPLVVPVQIESADQAITGFSTDISSAGMTIARAASVPRVLNLTFALPDSPLLHVPAIVCWRSADKIGVQFLESADVGHVEQWLQRSLGIVQLRSAEPFQNR